MGTKQRSHVDAFTELFRFNPKRELWVGVEQQCHLIQDGRIVPIAPEIIQAGVSPRHTFKLSACQLESRTNPCPLERLKNQLKYNERELRVLEQRHNFTRSYAPVAPMPVPLDVYPDPRYLEFAKNLPHYILAATCWVIGTHIHVGMPDAETAMRIHSHLMDFGGSSVYRLCSDVKDLNGDRLALFQLMAGPNWQSTTSYCNWGAFYRDALQRGYDQDPRRNWALVRITVHGTIEFQLFPATNDHDLIYQWAAKCHELCAAALNRLRNPPPSNLAPWAGNW